MNQFGYYDIRVARILEVKVLENKDKLVKIDLGESKPTRII